MESLVQKIILSDKQRLKEEKISEFERGLRPDNKRIGGYQSGEYANESILYPKEEVGVGRKLLQSGIKGAAGFADMFAGLPENYKKLGQYITTPGMPVPRSAAPVQTFLTEKGILKPEAEFNTTTGRIADFTTQLATGGGINPYTAARSFATKPLLQGSKDLARQLSITGAQGLFGGGTSEALKSAGIESPVAQFLTTGGVMGAAGAPFALRHTASSVANEATNKVTNAQLAEADKLVKQSYSLGAPITGAEALAKVTGASPLTSVQRIVENSPQSSEKMASFMAQRPQANEQMIANALRQISPNQPTSATPGALQKAGANLISGAEKSLTENVSPLYQKSGRVNVYPEPAVLANPRVQDAIDEVTKTAKYGVKGMPATSFETLIAAKKYLNDSLQVFHKD